MSPSMNSRGVVERSIANAGAFGLLEGNAIAI